MVSSDVPTERYSTSLLFLEDLSPRAARLLPPAWPLSRPSAQRGTQHLLSLPAGPPLAFLLCEVPYFLDLTSLLSWFIPLFRGNTFSTSSCEGMYRSWSFWNFECLITLHSTFWLFCNSKLENIFAQKALLHYLLASGAAILILVSLHAICFSPEKCTDFSCNAQELHTSGLASDVLLSTRLGIGWIPSILKTQYSHLSGLRNFLQ